MKNQTQFIENELRTLGFVTRNYALSNYISRLGALICYFNKNGYVIRGVKVPVVSRWGKTYDYRYEVFSMPPVPVSL